MLPNWCSAARLGAIGRRRGRCQRVHPRASLLPMRRCTRSVGITPLLIGCIATERVQRDVTGVALPGLDLSYAGMCSVGLCASC